MPAEDDARQQAARIRSEDHRLAVEVLSRPDFDCLLASHEQIFVDDRSFRDRSLNILLQGLVRREHEQVEPIPAPAGTTHDSQPVIDPENPGSDTLDFLRDVHAMPGKDY
ncbi:MAG: hypothetical protein IKE24_10780 [Clostridia bacterium]|nr:hypothetical protein [Clostridia bacterium]